MFTNKGYLTKHTRQIHTEAGCVKAVRKVLIRPNARDRGVLRRWFGCSRSIYNHTLDFCKRTRCYNEHIVNASVATESSIPEARSYLRKLPSNIRKLTVKEACEAYKSNFAKRELDPGHKFDMRYRSKKNRTQQIKIERRSLSAKGGRLRIFLTNSELSKEGFGYDPARVTLSQCTSDFSLLMDAECRYWLLLPYNRFPARENQAAGDAMEVEKSQCALDPGVHTFITTYSPDGTSYKLGDEAACRLYRLQMHLDRILSDIDTCKKRGKSLRHKRGLKRAAERLRARIKNLTADLHWKTAAFLCDRYATIVIPPFETQRMSRRAGRRLRKKSVRQMQVLPHYTFRQRLLHAASLKGVAVLVMGEEYTSKTCGACGFIHRRLGGAREYRCPSCEVRYDRDAGGARNIFLKNLEF